jgi:hypothetical protein
MKLDSPITQEKSGYETPTVEERKNVFDGNDEHHDDGSHCEHRWNGCESTVAANVPYDYKGRNVVYS